MNFVEKLTEEQKKELELLIKIEDSVVVRRAQAILMIEQKLPTEIINKLTGYKRSVAVKLRKKFILEGKEGIETKKRKKVKALLTKGQKASIIVILNTEQPIVYGYYSEVWTTRILASLIQEQYGVEFKSKTSLYLIFKEAKFSFRKPEKRSEKYDQKAVDDWREKYTPIVEEECARPDTVVLVGDEAAITSVTRLQRAWLPTNAPAFIEDTSKRKIVHFYGFLNVQSGVATCYKTSEQTSETTVHVLKKLLKEYQGKRVALFWDNASWHKSASVREFLGSVRNLKLYNFPPYAPELNPQEHVWKEVRDKVINNRHIPNIESLAIEALDFINKTLFRYEFVGAHRTPDV